MTVRGSTDRKEMGSGNPKIKWAFHCAKYEVSQRGPLSNTSKKVIVPFFFEMLVSFSKDHSLSVLVSCFCIGLATCAKTIA
jgi:hypothetical protein